MCPLKRAYRGRRPKWRPLIGQSGQTPRTCEHLLQPDPTKPCPHDSSFHPPWDFFSEICPQRTLDSHVKKCVWASAPRFSYIPGPRHFIIDPVCWSPDHTMALRRKLPTSQAIAVYSTSFMQMPRVLMKYAIKHGLLGPMTVLSTPIRIIGCQRRRLGDSEPIATPIISCCSQVGRPPTPYIPPNACRHC